jgi:hypothetical protein
VWPIQASIYLNDVNEAPRPLRTPNKDFVFAGKRDEMYPLKRVLNTGKHVCQRKRKKRMLDSYMAFLNQQ